MKSPFFSHRIVQVMQFDIFIDLVAKSLTKHLLYPNCAVHQREGARIKLLLEHINGHMSHIRILYLCFIAITNLSNLRILYLCFIAITNLSNLRILYLWFTAITHLWLCWRFLRPWENNIPSLGLCALTSDTLS